MKAIVMYDHPVDIELEDKKTRKRLPMKDQTVEIIGMEGDNIYICKTVGFGWAGTFTLAKKNVRIIEER